MLNTVPAANHGAVAKSIIQNQQRSPQGLNADSHNAKMARLEASASHGFGGGIPTKIDEGVEPAA